MTSCEVSTLIVTTQPGNAVAGRAFGIQPVLDVLDTAGSRAAGSNLVTVSAKALSPYDTEKDSDWPKETLSR